MPSVRVSIHLPYRLVLPSGEYPTPGVGGSVRLTEASVLNADGTVEARTGVSALFDPPDSDDAEAQERQRQAEADRLLRRVNRLLRWYRVTTAQAAIIELTRAQASPFWFAIEASAAAWGGAAPLEYEAASLPLPAKASPVTYGDAVRHGLGDGTDPDVATLNLLDAQYALSVGRFREAVLLCWGAIDSTFVRKFKSLVDEHLGDEWTDGRDFLKGIDFGLRHKMTTGLRLLEGQIAHEDDAKLAIKVARRVVQIVASLPNP